MGLAQELTLAEAVEPLTAFGCISFDVVSTMIDFESAIEDRLAFIATDAGKFTKPDYQLRSMIGLTNAGNAGS
jgi:hypothetical protein